jgi:hypothetical protein
VQPAPAHGARAQRIPLCESITFDNVLVLTTAPNPLGVQVRPATSLIGVVKVTSVPTGGSGQSLNVFLEQSCDGGQSWSSLVGTPYITSTGTFYAPISLVAPPTFGVYFAGKGVFGGFLGGDSPGPIGDRIRVKYQMNPGTGAVGQWSFQAYVLADSLLPGMPPIEISPPTSASNTNGSYVALNPLGTRIRVARDLVAVIKVCTAPSGGSPLFDGIFQHSCDDGQTWCDFAHAQVSDATNDIYMPVSVLVAGATYVSPIVDGALGVNVVTQGPIGDRIRFKYKAAPGTSGCWTFQAMVVAD